jgi:ABC-type antimicrobial peptide transport system, permease component
MITVPGGSTPKQIRIVGVARDVHYDRMAGRDANLRNPATEMIYLPFTEPGRRSRLATMIVRSAADPVTLNMPLRRAVERRAGLQLGRVTTLGSWLDDATARERFSGALATVFGVLAVMLAAIGVLGVLSYQVARRTKEIGVRMALGARRSDTVGLVMKETLGMLLMALAVGLPCAIGAAWLIRAQLYGVAPWDPRAAVAATVVIVAAGIIASLVPSYRASCVDPLVALREE